MDYSKVALREALAALRDDPARREQLGRNACRLARERYNWGREAAALIAAYRDLVPPSAPLAQASNAS